MLSALSQYLATPAIQAAVLVPGGISLFWLLRACRRQDVDPVITWSWMLSLVVAYFSSNWKVTDELRELYIIPAFLLVVAVFLYCRRDISPAAAFSLTFLGSWSVDMMRAWELVGAGEVPASTFYFGVGGAGAGDGLYFFPLLAAFLVVYAKCRQSPASWRA